MTGGGQLEGSRAACAGSRPEERTVIAGEVDRRPVKDADKVGPEAGLVHLDDRLEEGLDELALDREDVVLEEGCPELPARVERR